MLVRREVWSVYCHVFLPSPFLCLRTPWAQCSHVRKPSFLYYLSHSGRTLAITPFSCSLSPRLLSCDISPLFPFFTSLFLLSCYLYPLLPFFLISLFLTFSALPPIPSKNRSVLWLMAAELTLYFHLPFTDIYALFCTKISFMYYALDVQYIMIFVV